MAKREIIPFNGTRRFKAPPTWIVVHYTGSLASAKATARSMVRRCNSKSARKSCSHVIIDAGAIVSCVPLSREGWHVVPGENPGCAASNRNSIAVDLCEKKINTKSKRAADNDWYFEEATLDNGARVVAELADQYAIPMSNIVRHYDVTGKACPRPFTGQDVNAYHGATGEELWAQFLDSVAALRA